VFRFEGFAEVVLGTHVEMNVSETDAKFIPQLDPRVEGQFKWMQFLVWRKWMAAGALLISSIILLMTAYDVQSRMHSLFATIERCEAGIDNSWEVPGHPNEDPQDILDSMVHPFGDVKMYMFPLVSPMQSFPPAVSAGVSENIFMGECAWMPFNRYTPHVPPRPQLRVQNETPGFGTSVPRSFIKAPDDLGCNKDKKEQYAQPQECICGVQVQVFEDYHWLNMNEEMPNFPNGTSAKMRNMLLFRDPKFCQLPQEKDARQPIRIYPANSGSKEVSRKCVATDRNGQNHSGLLEKFVLGATLCLYSKHSSIYPKPTSFPKLRTRRCCMFQEFFFTNAPWNSAKQLYDLIQISLDLVVVLNNILMAILAIHHWSNWKHSSKYFFFAWVFPFTVKFLQHSIPAFEAMQVNPEQISATTLKYVNAQQGFDDFNQFQSFTRMALIDNLKSELPSSGSDMIFAGAGCHQPFVSDLPRKQQMQLKTRLLTSPKLLVAMELMYKKLDEHKEYLNGKTMGYPEGMDFMTDWFAKAAPHFYDATGFPQVEKDWHKYSCFYARRISSKWCSALPTLETHNITRRELYAELCFLEGPHPIYGSSKECTDPTFLSHCAASCASWQNTATNWARLAPYMSQEISFWRSFDPEHWFDSSYTWLPPSNTPDWVLGLAEDNDAASKEFVRLWTCDPKNAMRVFQRYSDGPASDHTRAFSTFQNVSDIPALGSVCRNVTDAFAINKCFLVAKNAFPMPLDITLSNTLQELAKQLEVAHNATQKRVADSVRVGTRAKAASESLIGLFPITFSLLPGFAKGAKKVKNILPQSPLVSYVLVLVPPLQLPMLAVVLCSMVQIGGSFWCLASAYFLIVALVVPIFAAQQATGPHETGLVFNAFHKSRFKLCGKSITLSVAMLQLPLMILSVLSLLMFLGLNPAELDKIGLGNVFGQATSMAIAIFKGILNFFKSKTFTVVMSSDLMLNCFFTVHGWNVLYPTLCAEYEQRMASGMLMTLKANKAGEMKEKYDEDKGGTLDKSEIDAMFSDLFKSKKIVHERFVEQVNKKYKRKLTYQDDSDYESNDDVKGHGDDSQMPCQEIKDADANAGQALVEPIKAGDLENRL